MLTSVYNSPLSSVQAVLQLPLTIKTRVVCVLSGTATVCTLVLHEEGMEVYTSCGLCPPVMYTEPSAPFQIHPYLPHPSTPSRLPAYVVHLPCPLPTPPLQPLPPPRLCRLFSIRSAGCLETLGLGSRDFDRSRGGCYRTVRGWEESIQAHG